MTTKKPTYQNLVSRIKEFNQDIRMFESDLDAGQLALYQKLSQIWNEYLANYDTFEPSEKEDLDRYLQSNYQFIKLRLKIEHAESVAEYYLRRGDEEKGNGK